MKTLIPLFLVAILFTSHIGLPVTKPICTSLGNTRITSICNGLDNESNPPVEPVYIKETYMVEMRDGVSLATDVYLPKTNMSPHASILIRTPYNKDGWNLGGWADAGWPSLVQDMRGRFASEGTDTVFRNAHTDGPDTLAWISNQTWSNGKIVTYGGSAMGINQYYNAGANPPQLTCQYISVATPNLYKHGMYQGGEFRKNMVEGWLNGQGSTFILPELWEHENYTLDYWTNVSLEDNWQDVNVPAIHIGGWFDCFSQGTIDGFMGYQHHGGPGAKGQSKLIIGPWTHGGFGRTQQGELRFPENAIDSVSWDMFLEMMEEHANNGPANYSQRPNVSYYVMGDVDDPHAPGNKWRYAKDWPLSYTEQKWYLHPNGHLNKNIPADETPLTYLYDPSNPVPTVGGQNLGLPSGPHDQRPVENRDDVLVFTSDPLTEPYEATGPIRAQLYISSDRPDTDFTVKLTDVYPDGRSMLITDGILRVRNRNGCDHWELINPGEIYTLKIDLWSTSYIWNTGHRIRVAVSSSNYPRFLNNPNTHHGINKNNGQTNIAHNTLYLDNDHPSCIILPEIRSPTVTIIKPENALYFNDRKIISLNIPIIIGKITIKIDVFDPEMDITKVEFFIDNQPKQTITTEPYNWTWNEKSFGKHTLHAKCYNSTAETDNDTITLWKFI